METIYVDSLFGLNFLVNYFLLLCAAKVSGAVLHRWRIAAGAALGALYAVVTVLPGMGFTLSAPVKLAAGVLMVLVAMGGERRFLRCCVVFFAVSAAFGGAVWAASMLSGGAPNAGRIYLPVSFKVLVLSFAVCYAAVSIVFRRAGKSADDTILELEISLLGRSIRIHALHDTGNTLHDPISGRSVFIAEARELAPLFPGARLEGGAAELVQALSALPGCEKRFRLIPYNAVGISGGLLAAFLPDEVKVDGRAERDVLIAINASRLSESGKYAALV